jgi:hypothetical protein
MVPVSPGGEDKAELQLARVITINPPNKRWIHLCLMADTLLSSVQPELT